MSHRSDVATFFEPSVTVIKDAIREQRAASSVPVTVSCSMKLSPPSQHSHDTKSVLLVGGFGASQWLFSNIQAHLQAERLNAYRPDSYLWAFH